MSPICAAVILVVRVFGPAGVGEEVYVRCGLTQEQCQDEVKEFAQTPLAPGYTRLVSCQREPPSLEERKT